MLSIARIFGSHCQEDPLHRWIPASHFVADDVLATKTGDLVMAMELSGIDPATATQETLDNVAVRFHAALRGLDERFSLHQYLVKRSNAPVIRAGANAHAEFLEASGVYSIRLFATVALHQGPVGVSFGHALTSRSDEILRKRLRRDIAAIKDVAYVFADHLNSVAAAYVLDRGGLFELFATLANPGRDLPMLKYDEHIDYFCCASPIVESADGFRWGAEHARVFALKEEPGATFAHMLRDLVDLRSNLMLCTEWRPAANASVAQLIRGKRRRAWAQRHSTVETAWDGGKNKRPLEDVSAVSTAEELNQALAAITVGGNHFGHCSLSIVLHDRDETALSRAATDLVRIFRDHDATLLEERLHRRRTYFAMMPGNSHLNIRYHYLLDRNYADLAPLYRPAIGEAVNRHLADEYLTVLETPAGTPFYLNLHVGEVAASLVLGKTGSGKSFLLSHLIEQAQKYPGIHTFVVDIGGSYRDVTRRCGGTYSTVALDGSGFRVNPFALRPTDDSVDFVRQFVRVLLLNGGYTPTPEDDRILHDEIRSVYALREEKRQIGALSLPKRLAAQLQLWTGAGPYACFVDQESDTLISLGEQRGAAPRFHAWDFAGLDRYPQLLGPLMFYLFHRVSRVVTDIGECHACKQLIVDEAWKFGCLRDLIKSAAKTWRKHNAWLIFSTQDLADARDTDLFDTLNSCCATKIFLPAPGADAPTYSDVFALNERERELLAEMRTGEMLVKTPQASHRLRLRVPPEQVKAYEGQFQEARCQA